jgi:protease IV
MDDNAAQPPQPPPQFNAPPPTYSAPPPPPPASPPPRITAPSGRRPARTGYGWMVLAIILFLFLCVSALMNMRHLAGRTYGKSRMTHTVGPKLEEVLVEDNDAANKIAIVDVNGIITSRNGEQGFNMVEVIKAQFKDAAEDSKVKAVILKVDSPGGEVLASDEINRIIADFQTNSPGHKPVIASMGNLAASGGYYISAPCQWIVANELTITGSIGVIMHGWNYRELMDKVGLLPQTYKSGKFKDMLSGERKPDEIPPEEKAMVQGLIDETYQKFKSVVAAGRKQASAKNNGQGRTLSQDWADYADGRVLSGTEAYKLGFVDQLGNFQEAVKRAKLIAGIGNANLVEYQQHFDLSDFFRMFGKTKAPAMKIDLGIDAPKLQTGQLYFIWPTYTH